MNFSQAIEHIRDLSRDDITSIVSDYVELKRSGSSMKGCCPFHHEKTPSFYVSDQKGIYKCFGCGIGGDAIDFLMRIESLEFHEVIYRLADRYHLTIDTNRTWHSRSKVQTAESLVPGIKDVRSEIRKSDNVYIVFNDAPLDQLNTPAKIELTQPLDQEQAKILKKYTNQCVMVPNNIDCESFKKSLIAVLACNFTVSVWDNGSEHDWLHYILRTYEVSRSEVIQLLATLTDSITRSVYMTEYLNQKNQTNVREA